MSVIPLPETREYQDASRAQRAAADPGACAWVSANAGSGKTKVLIDRVARLLLRGAQPDAILCVTYTRAAANEMLARLFERLGEWSVMPAHALCATLARLESRPPESYSEADLRRARTLFANALETPGGLRIETLHAFCARVLRRFPVEAGVPPGFAEIEEAEADTLWQGALADAVLQADAPTAEALDRLALAAGGRDLASALRPVRSRASLILALAERHDQDNARLSEGLRDWLGAPADPVETLLARAMGPELPADEFRRLAATLEGATKQTEQSLREALLVAVSGRPAAERLDALQKAVFTDKGEVRKRIYTQEGAALGGDRIADLFANTPPQGREITRLLALRDAIRRREAFERTQALLIFGLAVLRRCEAAKVARAALDFDDLIVRTRALLTQSGGAQWVLYKLDGTLSHVLLDEAQDTSPDQWEVLNALTEDFFTGAGRPRADLPRTLFVVGDEKQSIYSFQGADPQRFLAERRTFAARTEAGGNAVQPDMVMSFRSTPAVLNFVDTVLASLPSPEGDPGAPEPPTGARIAARHTAHRSTLAGTVELRDIEPRYETGDPDPWSAPVDALSSASPKLSLARWIAARCAAMVADGEAVWQATPEGFRQRPVTPGDILILVQSRKGGLFDALIAALKAQGLPVAGADRLVLGDHVGVQDCLNLIRFALCPADDLVVAELLKSPFLNLVDEDRDIYPLCAARTGGERLFDTLSRLGGAGLEEAKAFLAGLLQRRHQPAFDFLESALRHRFDNATTARDRLLSRLGEPARDPLQELLASALAADARSPASLQVFLHRAETETTEIKRDLARPEGEVRVMTVHGAKGLEAPIVILADTTGAPKTAGDGVFVSPEGWPAHAPTAKSDPEIIARLRAEATRKAVEEHGRLLYVALTRAQDRLIICGDHRGKPDEPGFRPASWYETCRTAMDALGVPSPDRTAAMDAPAIRRFGAEPVRLGAATGPARAATLRPDWMDRPSPATAPHGLVSAPSGLLAETGPGLAPFGPKSNDRFRRGRLIHTLLQVLPDMAAERREAAAHALLARIGDLDSSARRDIADAALGVLRHPDISEVFAPGSRAEVPVAGEIDTPFGRQRVNGRIDRLVAGSGRVLIVDYKTNRPPPRREEEVDPAYLAQMAAYRGVLSGVYPGLRIDCALVWTDGPSLMRLSPDRLDRALNFVRAGLQAGTTAPNS